MLHERPVLVKEAEDLARLVLTGERYALDLVAQGLLVRETRVASETAGFADDAPVAMV